MKYAVQFYGDISNPEGAPEEYPTIVNEVADSVISLPGYTIMTLEQLDARKAEFQLEYNAWAYVYCRPRVIQGIRDQIDNTTDELIANGFIYPYSDNVRFKMDLEHQSTYKGVYDLRQYVTFPYVFKGVGENYYTLNTEQDLINFILYSFQWMENTIQTGWVLKTALEQMTCEQLANWTDPRL
jgi:hypothetical protein